MLSILDYLNTRTVRPEVHDDVENGINTPKIDFPERFLVISSSMDAGYFANCDVVDRIASITKVIIVI